MKIGNFKPEIVFRRMYLNTLAFGQRFFQQHNDELFCVF